MRTVWRAALLSYCIGACESEPCEDGSHPSRKLFEDTLPSELCATDKFTLIPNRAELYPLGSREAIESSTDGGIDADAGVRTASDRGALRMSVTGRSAGGQNREGALVDIGLTARSASAPARLRPVDANCVSESNAALRCRLSVQGTASFDLVHQEQGGDDVTVTATSGMREAVRALVTVVAADVGAGSVRVDHALPSLAPSQPVCVVDEEGNAPRPDCDDTPRAVPVWLELLRTDSAGVATSVQATRSANAELRVYTRAGRPAWLSSSALCDVRRGTSALDVRIAAGQSRSASVFLCAPLSAGSYEVSGTLSGASALAHTASIATRAVPVRIGVSRDQADAATRLDVLLDVEDCTGAPAVDVAVELTREDRQTQDIQLLDSAGRLRVSDIPTEGRLGVSLIDSSSRAPLMCTTSISLEEP